MNDYVKMLQDQVDSLQQQVEHLTAIADEREQDQEAERYLQEIKDIASGVWSKKPDDLGK